MDRRWHDNFFSVVGSSFAVAYHPHHWFILFIYYFFFFFFHFCRPAVAPPSESRTMWFRSVDPQYILHRHLFLSIVSTPTKHICVKRILFVSDFTAFRHSNTAFARFVERFQDGAATTIIETSKQNGF